MSLFYYPVLLVWYTQRYGSRERGCLPGGKPSFFLLDRGGFDSWYQRSSSDRAARAREKEADALVKAARSMSDVLPSNILESWQHEEYHGVSHRVCWDWQIYHCQRNRCADRTRENIHTFKLLRIDHPNCLELEITHLPPIQAAQAILTHVEIRESPSAKINSSVTC